MTYVHCPTNTALSSALVLSDKAMGARSRRGAMALSLCRPASQNYVPYLVKPPATLNIDHGQHETPQAITLRWSLSVGMGKLNAHASPAGVTGSHSSGRRMNLIRKATTGGTDSILMRREGPMTQ